MGSNPMKPRLFLLLLLFFVMQVAASAGEPAPLDSVAGLAFGTSATDAVAFLTNSQNAKLVRNEIATDGYIRLSGGVVGGLQVSLWDLHFVNDKLFRIDLWLEAEHPFTKLDEVTSLLSKKYGWAMQKREFDFPFNLPLKKPDLSSPSDTIPAFRESKAHFSSHWNLLNGTVDAYVTITTFEELALILSYRHSGFSDDAAREQSKRLDEL